MREIDDWSSEAQRTLQINSQIFLEGDIQFDLIENISQDKIVEEFLEVINTFGIEGISVKMAVTELARNYQHYSSLSMRK